jgi:hypothetical protein
MIFGKYKPNLSLLKILKYYPLSTKKLMDTPINTNSQIITLTTSSMSITPFNKELSHSQQNDTNKLTDASIQTNNTVTPTMNIKQSAVSQAANLPIPPIPMNMQFDPMYIVNASLVTVFAKVVSDLFRSK